MTNSDYGTYRFSYTPPNDPGADYPLITIEMSTGGDATVSQMLSFFEAFMAASGYSLKGELRVMEPEELYDRSSTVAQGYQSTDFVSPWPPCGDTIVRGGIGMDTISF
jgi:hypothetical protein